MSTFLIPTPPRGVGARTDGRVDYRWNIPIEVRVKGRKENGEEFVEDGVTTDVSSSGMSIMITTLMNPGQELTVMALDEGFESPATIIEIIALDSGKNRTRVRFPKGTRFSREMAKKKFVYDYAAETWEGYIQDATFYNYRNRPLGRVEGNEIISYETERVMWRIKEGRLFNNRAQCVGHII